MRVDRTAAAAFAGAAAILIGGGTALAGQAGTEDRGARCEERLARIAEKQGVSVAQLEARIDAKLIARVDAALQAGRISPERAARIKERISETSLCEQGGLGGPKAKLGTRWLLAAAAEYLGLTRAELRAQLKGTSLAALALGQGKSVDGLKAAMLEPAEAKLAKAVELGRVTQAQANRMLERLEKRVDRLVTRVFPAG